MVKISNNNKKTNFNSENNEKINVLSGINQNLPVLEKFKLNKLSKKLIINSTILLNKNSLIEFEEKNKRSLKKNEIYYKKGLERSDFFEKNEEINLKKKKKVGGKEEKSIDEEYINNALKINSDTPEKKKKTKLKFV